MIIPPEESLHPWLAHLKGFTTLVKARNKQPGISLPGSDLFIAIDNFHDKTDPSLDYVEPVEGWFTKNPEQHGKVLHSELITPVAPGRSSHMNGQSITASLDDLILRATPILQAAPSVLRSSHSQAKANIELLLAAARTQLSNFRSWPVNMPDYWQPRIVHLQVDESELYQQDLISSRADLYSDR
jgi:hypothetical protein